MSERRFVLPEDHDGRPINGPAKYHFKLSELTESFLPEWPPDEALFLGWEEAVGEIKRHWKELEGKTLWSPYPVRSYCVAFASGSLLSPNISDEGKEIIRKSRGPNAPDDVIQVSYFLFPVSTPKQQSQAVAKLICATAPGTIVGDVRVWVDALSEDELDSQNRREIAQALGRMSG